MSAPRRIATVIVTWNQPRLTLECLAALAADAGLGDVWVVDNGSKPEVLLSILERFPQVRAVRLDQNLGFAGGCNAGAAAALADGADALFLLNNDALVEPGTMAVLAASLARDPQVAAVSPKVYYAGTPRVIQSVGIRIDPNRGQGRMIGSGEVDRGQHDRREERDALFGCALLIRRAAWEQVGPFWAPFHSYAEETDWCLRAGRAGWRLIYEPSAAVWHRTSSSLGHDSPLKVYLIARNQLYLRRRNQEGCWRGGLGLLYALYANLRTWLRYLRLGQGRQARALALGIWDYWQGRTGPGRDAGLRRTKA